MNRRGTSGDGRRIIMPKHRREIAVQVAQSLHATEAAIDGAIAKAAEFVGLMPMARMEARFAASVGQDAMNQAIAAMTALAQARQAMVAAHEALAVVQDQFHLGPLNFGSLGEKPAYPNQAMLRVVAA
jgi:hypothetical protein